jgi:tagatose-6-phosphate ketose/aldose isomerase
MTDGLSGWSTWREITAQPAIWRDWATRFDAAPVRDWVERQRCDEVWFCGAGTSAYIGDIIVAGLEGAGGPRLRSVPTTSVVSRPGAFLRGRRPLVVSFGRSGDSAESIGLLDALDRLAPLAPRLHITCNARGALATRGAAGPQLTICLPEATHDAGFAMTSSFSTMLLTALRVFDPVPPDGAMGRLAARLDHLLPAYAAQSAQRPAPKRIVFLGTGALAGAAREAALKVMELTAGRIPALSEETLGFRHGPKSFVRAGTAIAMFLSSDAHARAYEDDLERELRAQFPDASITTIGPGGEFDTLGDGAQAEAQAEAQAGAQGLPDAWAVPLAVAYAQVLGASLSHRMGLNVDDPFAGAGTLSRVVAGVRLHPVGG